jgi:pimeloyl-ACP methyl ester carboxylesterase
MIPVWKSEELAALMPSAKLTIMEGQGHGVQWEAADQFNAVVTEFIAQTAAEALP